MLTFETDKARNAEFAEIILCRDCDNWDTEWKPIWGKNPNDMHYCFVLDQITAGNFFCAYGEEKKE